MVGFVGESTLSLSVSFSFKNNLASFVFPWSKWTDLAGFVVFSSRHSAYVVDHPKASQVLLRRLVLGS